MPARRSIIGLLTVVLASSTVVSAAPFDVYFRPSDKANWTFYGGRDSRAAADTAAADLARSTGFATKVFALGEPVGRVDVGPTVRESVNIGARSYVRRPGLGYTPGWYRHGGGWGGGYGGHSGSSSHHHHSSHHHSHSHHSSSHHSGSHPTAHPSHSATHAGGRGGRGAAHHSASHHSHSHSHSHSHHSHSHHGGHHR